MYLRLIDFNYPTEVELISIDNDLLSIGYYSLAENMRYFLQSKINTTVPLTIGTAPYGGVAVWSNENLKTKILQWIKADTLPTPKEAFEIINTPPRELFDNYMKQFTYKYQVEFGHWNKEKQEWSSDDQSSEVETLPNKSSQTPDFDYIEEVLYDGTHDKLHDGGLMKYHEAGKPKKLAVRWHLEKKEWTAYFWFEDEEIRRVYDRFYGVHPDTKTDFIIRIDPEKNKYELALYRYGLREPQFIPENVYQLLVFKNKFECFRSKNYNQERGAWIW